MITRQAYEQASQEFKAARSAMSPSEFDAARINLNKMFKELQLAEAKESFKAGDKIESQTFLWLCQEYNVQINESFNALMQKDVVSVSTSGYDSYKITKKQEKQLKGFILKLLEAIQ